jgi:hypothetical protein
MTAQRVELSEGFAQKLAAASMEWVVPLDSDYKDIHVLENDLQSYDFAIRSKKEKLEIRYIIQPYQENDLTAHIPHIQFIRMLTHLATNEQEAIIAIHDVSEEDLSWFHADWGKSAFFKLKDGFSGFVECRLLSLYKEEKGMAHVLFVYQQPTVALDNRFFALQFK